MNLSRRFIVMAVLVVGCAVSLGFAGMAQAYGTVEAAARKECQDAGGDFSMERGVDLGNGHWGDRGTCTIRTCTVKLTKLGPLTIPIVSCKATSSVNLIRVWA